MPLQATSGAASYDAFGGGVPVVPNYIEDVFSTYLYTGTGASQTITNGIDLSGKGGLVWLKIRNGNGSNRLVDTVRGGGNVLTSNAANANVYDATIVPTFSSSGFDTGGGIDISSYNYVSWTFRKQPKFFDIQTWTNGVVNHNLGSVPGCIIYKSTNFSENWWVLCRQSNGTYVSLSLNTTGANQFTAASAAAAGITATTFDSSIVFGGSGTLVGYFFAHDAGGFGLTGTDNVISCGSFNYNTYPQTVTIGYEPQWLMVKQTDGTGDWIMFDNMRGFTANASGGIGKSLLANTSGAETNDDSLYYGGATGFNLNLPSYGNYIYIAIRRGPMKVPTTGTSVYNAIVRAGTGTATAVTGAGFPPDFMISHSTNVGSNNVAANDKLRGPLQFMATNTTGAESTVANALVSLDQDGFSVGTLASGPYNVSGQTNAAWMFKRAPSFFDEVCYTGTGSATTVTHNLTVVPELMIVKRRNASTYSWIVYASALGATKFLFLENTDAASTFAVWNNTTPTSSVFSIGTDTNVNASGGTYVWYGFATISGVSKVGSYTGTGTTKQIDCGFTGGARFVLIKRTDSTGDWYVWDSARGIVSGNDPYLLLNSAAAEVTNTDYIDTYSAGFEISSTAPAAINSSASGSTYIFLAIA